LIPEIFILPILFHFREHIHEIFFCPVDELKVPIWILEDFKDKAIKLIILVWILPFLNSIVAIIVHLDKDLELTS